LTVTTSQTGAAVSQASSTGISYGSEVTISASAVTGFAFDGWYDAEDNKLYGTPVANVTIYEDTTLEAKYVEELDLTNCDRVETFTNLDFSGNSYRSDSFTGECLIEWTYNRARNDFELDGSAILLEGKNGTLEATIPGGISSISLEFYDAFSGAAQVEIFINGNSVGESNKHDGDVGNASDKQTYLIENIDVAGTFTLKIVATDSQTVIDNVSWDPFSD